MLNLKNLIRLKLSSISFYNLFLINLLILKIDSRNKKQNFQYLRHRWKLMDLERNAINDCMML